MKKGAEKRWPRIVVLGGGQKGVWEREARGLLEGVADAGHVVEDLGAEAKALEDFEVVAVGVLAG